MPETTFPLTFRALREANVARCEEVFHPVHDWSPIEWAACVAGEAGELANLIKKVRRGSFTIDGVRKLIAHELADVVIYADLCAARCGIDLGAAVAAKFNQVSHRTGAHHYLAEADHG